MPSSLVSPLSVALAAASFASILGCNGPDGTEPGTRTTDTGQPDVEGPEALCQIDVQCFGNVLDEPKVPCTLAAVDAHGNVMYDGPAGLELRGRSSLTFPKKQYAVELRAHTELPVWPGASWRFLDDGGDLGTAWRTAGYDDAQWATGPAPFGYGADYLQTVVDEPGGGSATTYFRHTFTVGSLAEVTDVEIGLKRIGGAAVYLNGTEVFRDNLAPGASYDDLALRVDLDRHWRAVNVDPGLLVDGPNVLAVEVHTAALEDPAMVFDLYVEATGEDAPVNLLGMGREEDWILNGQYVDRVLFRNRLAYDLFQSFGEADRFATELRFCEMRLDGEYAGIYTLGERIERDDDRVAIGKGDQPGDTFIIKNDDMGVGFHDNAVGYGFWQLEHPDPDPEAVAAVSAWLDGWEAAVLGPDPVSMFDWLDLDSAVDWVLLNELFKNQDAYFLSVHLWKDQGGLMHFAPWDLDLSLGSYPNSDCGAEGWVQRRYWTPEGEVHDLTFIQRMAELPAFREALSDRWRELRSGPLAEDAIRDRIAHYDALLAPALEANLERWPVQDVVFSTPGVEDWLCPVSSYEEEHQRVLDFISDRLAWMDANIDQFDQL